MGSPPSFGGIGGFNEGGLSPALGSSLGSRPPPGFGTSPNVRPGVSAEPPNATAPPTAPRIAAATIQPANPMMNLPAVTHGEPHPGIDVDPTRQIPSCLVSHQSPPTKPSLAPSTVITTSDIHMAQSIVPQDADVDETGATVARSQPIVPAPLAAAMTQAPPTVALSPPLPGVGMAQSPPIMAQSPPTVCSPGSLTSRYPIVSDPSFPVGQSPYGSSPMMMHPPPFPSDIDFSKPPPGFPS